MPAVLSLWHVSGLEAREKRLEEWFSKPFENLFPWCRIDKQINSHVRYTPHDLQSRDNLPPNQDYQNLTRNNLYDRLGEIGCAGEEPLYEVMSGENIYDRVDLGRRQVHHTTSSGKVEDEDSGVDPEEGSDSLSCVNGRVSMTSESDKEPYVIRPQVFIQNVTPTGRDGLKSLTWLQKIMRNFVAPFIIKMRYVSIVAFAVILAFSIWGGTQVNTPNHPPEIFPRDSNIQHFINLSYDFTSTERCDKCSGYFADRTALEERARMIPKDDNFHFNNIDQLPGNSTLSGTYYKDTGIPSDSGDSTHDYDKPSTDIATTNIPKIKPNGDNEYVIPVHIIAKDPGIVDLCGDNVCTLTHTREDSASTAEVVIVFGIKGGQQDCSDICDPTKVLLVSKIRRWVPKYIGYHTEKNVTVVDWLALPFRSTTPNGISNCKAYHQWKLWQDFTEEQKTAQDFPEELESIFQTSDRWAHVFTEIVLVDGAIRGIAISLWFCIMATIIFTGHPVQTLIVISTIICEIGFVFGCFFLVGLELGAVEAISLAILVGTSVDYCVHLVEGYRLAGNYQPPESWSEGIRAWRLRHALNHIGVPIVSSAITTVLAAFILSLTQIQMFSRFGKILALTMTLSLIYTLFMAGSLLAVFAPVKYSGSGMASLKGLAISVALTCAAIPLPLYLFKEAIIC